MKGFRFLRIYALLIGGSIVFIWPFLWMAATSMKLDRELAGETLRFLRSVRFRVRIAVC